MLFTTFLRSCNLFIPFVVYQPNLFFVSEEPIPSEPLPDLQPCISIPTDNHSSSESEHSYIDLYTW